MAASSAKMLKPPPDSESDIRIKRLKRRYKLLGSATLLFAFLTQQMFLSYYESQKQRGEQARYRVLQLQNAHLASSLSYLSLYFSKKAATGEFDPLLIKKAASERTLELFYLALESDKPDGNAPSIITEFSHKESAVNDLQSYTQYLAAADAREHALLESGVRGGSPLNLRYKIASGVYLSLYFAGSLILLLSLRYD